MLSIPYLTASNEVVNIRFRNLTDSGPKYLQLPGTPVGPYNLKALTEDASTVVIAEGELDAVTLSALGIAAIGMPGANSCKHHYGSDSGGLPRRSPPLGAGHRRYRDAGGDLLQAPLRQALRRHPERDRLGGPRRRGPEVQCRDPEVHPPSARGVHGEGHQRHLRPGRPHADPGGV